MAVLKHFVLVLVQLKVSVRYYLNRLMSVMVWYYKLNIVSKKRIYVLLVLITHIMFTLLIVLITVTPKFVFATVT